jgi:hypothetical protein
MLNFTREQKGKAFDALPKDVKGVVTSERLSDIYQKIGKDNNLSIDKIGTLSNVVTCTILNLIPRDKLVATLATELGIGSNETTKLAKAVNDEVFLKIREILREEQEREETEDVETSEEESVPEPVNTNQNFREAILAEIEDPQPVAQPISTPNKMDAVTKNFIGGKLTETVSLPTQKVEIQLKKPEVKQKYSADPYRENVV